MAEGPSDTLNTGAIPNETSSTGDTASPKADQPTVSPSATSPVKPKNLSPKGELLATPTSNGVKDDPSIKSGNTSTNPSPGPLSASSKESSSISLDTQGNVVSIKSPTPSTSGTSISSTKPVDDESVRVQRTSSKRNTRSKASSEENSRKLSDGSRRSLIGKESPSSSESRQGNNDAPSSAAMREQKFRSYSNKSSKKKQVKRVEIEDEASEEETIALIDNSGSKRQTIDVSQFLNVKSFSNSVEIAVNNSKFSCSGAVLAYHSPVMASILMKGANIITLDKLCIPGADIAVEECLILLYGGGAVITNGNIEIMTKFSVLYQVENLYRLCCEWIRHYVSVENIYDMWLLGNVDYIAAKQTRRKNNIIHICRNFIKDRECEIALELRKRKKAKVEIEEGFILLMLQCTDYSTMFSDLL